MQRTTLTFASLAVAAAACALTWIALLERPAAPTPIAVASAPDPVPAPPRVSVSARARDDLRDPARDADAQEQALRDAILRIGDDDSVTLDVRLERYRAALDAAREASPIPMTPSASAELFLRMEGVQRELAALGPGARAREIAFIRRELGFGEDDVARMEQIDARREARWQSGLSYMGDRDRIAATFSGSALDEELRALRERYFGHEAATIEAEERDGFFRFTRPRVYGRN